MRNIGQRSAVYFEFMSAQQIVSIWKTWKKLSLVNSNEKDN